MKWGDLGSIDWELERSAEEWSQLLGELMKLSDSADSNQKRDKLADVMDAFADASWALEGLDVIRKLDTSARQAAQALRDKSNDQWLSDLAAASAAYRDAAKELTGVTANLKKEASLLRAEKINAAIKSLNDVIESMREVSKDLKSGGESELVASIGDLVKKAQKLRDVFEKS